MCVSSSLFLNCVLYFFFFSSFLQIQCGGHVVAKSMLNENLLKKKGTPLRSTVLQQTSESCLCPKRF